MYLTGSLLFTASFLTLEGGREGGMGREGGRERGGGRGREGGREGEEGGRERDGGRMRRKKMVYQRRSTEDLNIAGIK